MRQRDESIYRGAFDGQLPYLNRKLGATAIKDKGRLYIKSEWKKAFAAMVDSFARTAGAAIPIKVDALIQIKIGISTDSDAPIKAILDALQKGGVIVNDKLVRDMMIERYDAVRNDTTGVRVWLMPIDGREVRR